MFGSYFTNHKVISSNSNGSLFVSRRQSNTKNEIPSTKEDTSRYYNDSRQRNTSRKNSQDVRSSYNSLTTSQQQIHLEKQPVQSLQTAILNLQQSGDKHELLRNSFSNQKSNSNSSKQLNNENGFNSPGTNGGSGLFFQKTNYESKILQKKMNEGQLLSMQNQKTFTVGNYNTGTATQLNVNKFKIMLEQNNTMRTAPSHQNLFRNDTDRYLTENKDTLDSFQGNGGDQQMGEKENNKYFFSQFTKKNKQSQDIIQQSYTQNNLFPTNEVEDFTVQINQKNSAKKFANQIISTASQQTLDSANNLDQLASMQMQQNQSKPKNLQEYLKNETEKDNNYNNKSIGSGDLNQKHMSSQQLNDFFNQKKSVSPRKVIKEAAIIQSPMYRQQNSERKPILNSPDIQNSKSFENIFTQTQSVSKIKSFQQNLQQFAAQQNKTKQQASTGNGSLQSSFQVKSDLAQSTNIEEKQVSHYFTKDQDTVLNSGKKQHSQHNTNSLAGSIVNLKKPKKKAEGQQLMNNLHSSQESEISLLKMENINLKNQNQVLTMKNETLEKEKKHYKNICNKKQQELEQLNEQINSLRNQVDQMKIQIKLSTHSQESTLSQKPQTQVFQSTHNISSQDTPRQLSQNTNTNNNGGTYSSPLHFQSAVHNFSQQQQQQSYAQGNEQQNSNHLNSQNKNNQQSNQNQQNYVQNQLQQIQQHIENQQQLQNLSQLQAQNSTKSYQQYNVQSPIQSMNQLQISQNNNYSPQKSSTCLQTNKNNNNLSPIVNSEERSDFVSNSILEDIPTAQSHIRTINSSLVIQNLNINDDFEVIQNEYIANNNFQISNLYNTLPITSQNNSKF